MAWVRAQQVERSVLQRPLPALGRAPLARLRLGGVAAGQGGLSMSPRHGCARRRSAASLCEWKGCGEGRSFAVLLPWSFDGCP